MIIIFHNNLLLSVLRKIFFEEINDDFEEIIRGNCSRKKLYSFELGNITVFLRKVHHIIKRMEKPDNFKSYTFQISGTKKPGEIRRVVY